MLNTENQIRLQKVREIIERTDLTSSKQREKVDMILQRNWTKAVGTRDYNKSEWSKLYKLIWNNNVQQQKELDEHQQNQVNSPHEQPR